MAGRVLSLVFSALPVFLIGIRSCQGCELGAVQACVQNVLSDVAQICTDVSQTEANLAQCSTNNGCPVQDFRISSTCDVWTKCQPYLSCVGGIVGVDYMKVLFADEDEKKKADEVHKQVCSKSLDTWPESCTPHYLTCEPALRPDQNRPLIDDNFLRLINRYKQNNINVFKDKYCSACGVFSDKFSEAAGCTQWSKYSMDINQNNGNRTELCQKLSEGVDCLEKKAGECDPIFDMFEIHMEDTNQLYKTDIADALKKCDLSIPVGDYSAGSRPESGLPLLLFFFIVTWLLA